MNTHAKAAEGGYAKASGAKDLSEVSNSNLALLELYSGNANQALEMLDKLGDSFEIIVKRAIVLEALGERDTALSVLQKIPQERMDRRATALGLRLEGVE